jgi:hypothetical protein
VRDADSPFRHARYASPHGMRSVDEIMPMSRVKRTKDIPYTFETYGSLSVEKRAPRLRLQPHHREAPSVAPYFPLPAF